MLNKLWAKLAATWRADEFGDPDKDAYFDSGMWAANLGGQETAPAASEPAKPASTGWTFDKILMKPGHALAELGLLQAERYVPGQWQCDTCKFGLTQRTFHAADGTVSARDEEGELCPNCKTTLRRVTWRERADEAEEMLEQVIDERNKALWSGTPAVNEFVRKVAQVTTEVGFQAGEPAMELAGQIVSVLAVNPEQTDRFLEEGGELFIDGTFNAENGSLTYRAANGSIQHPSILRQSIGTQQ